MSMPNVRGPGIMAQTPQDWRLRHNTARSDVVAAKKPQPVEPLRVGQPNLDALVARHASPAHVLFLF